MMLDSFGLVWLLQKTFFNLNINMFFLKHIDSIFIIISIIKAILGLIIDVINLDIIS